MDNIVFSTRETIYRDFILNDEDTQTVLEKAKELEEKYPNWGDKSFYVMSAISELLAKDNCIERELIEQEYDDDGEEVFAVRIKKEDGEQYPIEQLRPPVQGILRTSPAATKK